MSKILLDDELLKDAVSIYQDRYFAKTEFNENEFETSSSFDNKIKKMAKSEHNIYHRITLTKSRKIICVLVAALTLIVSSLGVGATKNIIGGFYMIPGVGSDRLVEVIEEEASYPPEIEKFYEIDLSDEFELVTGSADESGTYYYYMSKEDSTFTIFEQYPREKVRLKVDNTQTTVWEEEYKGQEYLAANRDNEYYSLTWNNGEYLFRLYSNSFSIEEMLEICASLKEK